MIFSPTMGLLTKRIRSPYSIKITVLLSCAIWAVNPAMVTAQEDMAATSSSNRSTNMTENETEIDQPGKQVYQQSCFSCHDVGIADTPKLGDKEAWQARIEKGIKTLYQSALNGKGNMLPKGGIPSLTEAQLKAAVDYMLTAADIQTEQLAVTNLEPETTAGVSEPLTAGETIYRQLCFSCHDMGIANAPKLGDKAAWAPRIAAGMETLYHNAINGKGVMPMKGGDLDLTEDEVKTAVDWIISNSSS